VNAGYFSAGNSLSYVEVDGAILAQNPGTRPPRSVFGITGAHNEALLQSPISSAGQPQPAMPAWTDVLDAIGGGPNLVTAGAVDVTDVAEGFDAASGIDPNGRQPRTALGYDAERRRVFLVTVDGRQSGWSVGMTLTEMAWLLVDLGCTRGLNYDGGGSTTCWVAGGVVNRPSDGSPRPVATAWAVVPAMTVDNLDREVSIVGAWSASANSGYYELNSLIHMGSTGDNFITWSLPLQRGGVYDVYAWWIGSSNRATAAPYSIQHRGGVSDVAANQTVLGSRWNLLGSFTFDAGDSSFVRLTDAAPSNQYVSADAVRLVATNPEAVPGSITDDSDAAFAASGAWSTSSAQTDRYGTTYRLASGGDGANIATWTFNLAESGEYEVNVWYPASSNRAVDAPFIISTSDGDVTVRVNQQALSGRWVKLGEYPLNAGEVVITLSDDTADPTKFVVADAVMLVRRPTPRGDATFDGRVNTADLVGLSDCLAGPDMAAPPPCDILDFDGDQDVDLRDFAGFQDAL
jgi:hypothetical protein